MSKTTITLYDYFQSELIKRGFNEFVDEEGKLVFFNEKHQFIRKILSFDDSIKEIMDELFYGLSLNQPANDEHFKKTFLYRFINRQINRQTIESFQLELMQTFLSHEEFLNRMYEDLEKYITGTSETHQENQQVNDGTTLSDNRSAFQDLPQNQVNIDLDDGVMTSATDNTISRSRQNNQQQSDGTTQSDSKVFQLDQLLKSSQLLEELLNNFDRRCFLQIY